MQVIVLTPERTQENETEIVNSLFAHGLDRLHVRKPFFSEQDYRNYIAAIDSMHHSSVVIHGCFELYAELKLAGIHLNSAIRNVDSILENVKHVPPAAISTSFHSWQEIEENGFQYGYVFISPVFDSISKSGYKAGIDLRGALETKQNLARQKKYCPSIIGLGGVDEQNITELHQYGFDGVALLGAIWTANDLVEKYKRIKEIAKSL